jgi:hypothetical protein
MSNFLQFLLFLTVFTSLCFATPVEIPPDYILFRQVEEKLQKLPKTEKIFAISCEKPALRLGPSAQRSLSSAGSSFQLDQTSYYIPDALTLLEETTAGKSLVPVFRERFQSGELKVVQITDMGQSRCGKAALACFQPDKSTLYVDKSAEVGALAPVLLHEIVHALDEDRQESQKIHEAKAQALNLKYQEAIKEAADRVKKSPLELSVKDFDPKRVTDLAVELKSLREALQILSFKTESLAHQMGHSALLELVQKHRDYYSNRPVHSQDRSAADIVKDYGLSSEVIEKYLAGKCASLAP